MWLLKTDTAELKYFTRHFDADGGYAILSHTWQGEEQTLQEVREIGERCKLTRANPRDDPKLALKIREFCRLAQEHGYRWAWADSCCIDKTSSSELSEAINSMYQWYSDAEVCYAYLADVPSRELEDPWVADSPFRKSRWHRRGWTLQELIAPASLFFLSRDWKPLGSRVSLAELLEQITHIPRYIFSREARPSDYSVAERMHWASERQTTRLEDEAYCLMGLFGVSMPTNYGEGETAFVRLQHGIMRQKPDFSLFAFGYLLPFGDLSEHGVTLQPHDELNHRTRFFLASSPREFHFGYRYIFDLGVNGRQSYSPHPDASATTDASTTTILFGHVELPRISITGYGVKLRLPVFEDGSATVAVLLCEGREGHIGLLLHPISAGTDPIRPRYHAGCRYDQLPWGDLAGRLVPLGKDLYSPQFNGKRVEPKWRTIYVTASSSDLDSPRTIITRLTINSDPHQSFCLPHWLVSRFLALGFEVGQEKWDEQGVKVTRFWFHYTKESGAIYLDLGFCHLDPAARWSKITICSPTDFKHSSKFTRAHSCSKHHIDSWPSRSQVFSHSASNRDRSVRLSFTPCKMSLGPPKLVIHIELFGRAYEEMLRENNMLHAFPPLDAPERSAQLASPAHTPIPALLFKHTIDPIRQFHPWVDRSLQFLATAFMPFP